MRVWKGSEMIGTWAWDEVTDRVGLLVAVLGDLRGHYQSAPNDLDDYTTFTITIDRCPPESIIHEGTWLLSVVAEWIEPFGAVTNVVHSMPLVDLLDAHEARLDSAPPMW